VRYDPPAAPAVRDMLERVLSSETFRRSERARSLLAYLVDREQAGEAERLKGYTIGLDVFGKDQEFDSSTNAAVRVQAGRLRELLAHYYEAEGRADPLRIVVSRGSYVPSYEAACGSALTAPSEKIEQHTNGAAATTPVPAAASPPRGTVGIGQVRLLWGALAFVAVVLVVVAYRTAISGGDVQATASETSESTPAAVAVLPEMLPTIRIMAVSDDPAVTRVAALFRTSLASFDTLSLIGGEYSGTGPRLPTEPMGFVLSIASGATDSGVSLELQNLGSGRVLLNRSLSAVEVAPGRLEDEVASLVSAVAPMNGVIYSHLKQTGLHSELVGCLILNNAFYFDMTESRHVAAYRCFERLAGAHAKSPLVYAALASLRVSAKTRRFAYPPSLSDEDTMALARRAVQLGPTSPYAYAAMGYFHSQRGDHAEAIHRMRRAYQLNTFDLNVAAAFGYTLILSGEYREAAIVLQRAVDLSSVHPVWWDYCLFLAQFMLGDMDKAAQATDALSAAKQPQYLAARLIVALSRGDERVAGALATELVGAAPKFAADPEAAFREAEYPTDLTAKFVGALKRAGIGGAS
jgi:tetratricopeptide (TPR) repeat protein